MTMPPLVARKSTTVIHPGSVYKDRYVLPKPQPAGTTVRQEFLDSAGAVITEITGEVDGTYINFFVPYAQVASVPNNAGFYCYITRPDDEDGDEHMVRWGSVFLRGLTFPHSPAQVASTVVKLFSDDFQRNAGPVGGRWTVLLGKPRIFDNTEWFGLGEDHPNTVGPDYGFFPRYYMRYYQPFNDDTVDLSISATKKGGGTTIVTICGNSQATSYLYLGFHGTTNKIQLGVGHGPDVGTIIASSGMLEPKSDELTHTVPGNDGLEMFKLRYDHVLRKLTLFNEDYTTTYLEWVDEDEEVPHGKGYRYFGMGGNTGLVDSGVQLSYIRAAGGV